MSQRIHDPTETGMPEYSTTGTIREHTDWLKEVSRKSDFRANLEISALSPLGGAFFCQSILQCKEDIA